MGSVVRLAPGESATIGEHELTFVSVADEGCPLDVVSLVRTLSQ